MTLDSHQKTVGTSQVHLTPRWIIDELGPFGLDCDAKLERRDAEKARQYTRAATNKIADVLNRSKP
jgi:hypothetical protein